MKDMKNAIWQHFRDAWGNETEIVIDNMKVNNGAKEFIRFLVLIDDTNQASMNGGRKTIRVTGQVMIECFVAPAQGVERTDELFEKISDALQLVSLSGTDWQCLFRAARPITVGQPNGQTKYQINVSVPFVGDIR